MEANSFEREEQYFHINSQDYTGNIDFLVHLIKNDHLDIEQVDIGKIVVQFKYYLDRHIDQEIESGGKYTHLIVDLLYIKSQLRLKKIEEAKSAYEKLQRDLIDEGIEFLKEELIQKEGREYFERISRSLNGRPILEIDVFDRGDILSIDKTDEDSSDLTESDREDLKKKLIKSLAKVLVDDSHKKKVLSLEKAEKIQERMEKEIILELTNQKEIRYNEFVSKLNASEKVGSFLAILELAKQKRIEIFERIQYQIILGKKLL